MIRQVQQNMVTKPHIFFPSSKPTPFKCFSLLYHSSDPDHTSQHGGHIAYFLAKKRQAVELSFEKGKRCPEELWSAQTRCCTPQTPPFLVVFFLCFQRAIITRPFFSLQKMWAARKSVYTSSSLSKKRFYFLAKKTPHLLSKKTR